MSIPETGMLPPPPSAEDRDKMRLKKLQTLTEQIARWTPEPERLKNSFAIMGVTPRLESARDLEVAVGVITYLNRYPRSAGIA